MRIIMTEERLKLYSDYIKNLYNTDKSYDYIGKYIKHVGHFLENCDSVSRVGYARYKKKYTVILLEPLACAAICDFLQYCGVGFKRKIKRDNAKTLEKLSSISQKNKSLLNDFILWLHNGNEYSSNTMNIYYTSIKTFYEYCNDFSLDNARSFIKTLEEKGFSPSTIRLRVTSLERFGKYLKKPIELKRPKFKKKLDTDNIPTEEEYNMLLDYLYKRTNKDYYYYIKILALTGARISEFMQMKWEDVLKGEVVLKGKGNKYRRFFFTEKLRREVSEYVTLNNKSGLIAMGKFGLLTNRGFSMNLKRFGEKCGIDKRKMHPHAFRHFFAKMYLKKTKDVIELAELLGHSSIDTTRIYLQKSHEEQKNEFNKKVNW